MVTARYRQMNLLRRLKNYLDRLYMENNSFILLMNVRLKGKNIDQTVVYNPSMSHTNNRKNDPLYIHIKNKIVYDGKTLVLDETIEPKPDGEMKKKFAQILKDYTIKKDDLDIITVRKRRLIGIGYDSDGSGVHLFSKLDKLSPPSKLIDTRRPEISDEIRKKYEKNIETLAINLNHNVKLTINIILKPFSILTIDGKKYKIRHNGVGSIPTYYVYTPEKSKTPFSLEPATSSIRYDTSDTYAKSALFTKFGDMKTFVRTDVTIYVDDISGGKNNTCNDSRLMISNMFYTLYPQFDSNEDSVKNRGVYSELNRINDGWVEQTPRPTDLMGGGNKSRKKRNKSKQKKRQKTKNKNKIKNKTKKKYEGRRYTNY